MTMSNRGVHPDLIDEEATSNAAAPEPAPNAVRPSTTPGAERSSSGSAPSDQSSDAEPAESQSSAPPEWMDQVRAAKDPTEAFRLLVKNLPADEVARDEVISGLVGSRADLRARELLRQQEQSQKEQRKRDAAQRGDLYTLGELAAPEILERSQHDQAQQAISPFMQGVLAFQETLPAEVQTDVAGRTWPGTPAEGVKAYLEAVVQSAMHHGLETAVDKEIKKREPALRKAFLSDANGSAPTPEIEGGGRLGTRQITSEQVARMGLDEFEQYFDKNGRPKQGVQFIDNNGIPVRQR